ncbi:MAG: BadF/BadG/BcrA/BcrD ATPase family protein [Planctomycetaceae bacterium]
MNHPLLRSCDLIIGIDGGGTKSVAWLASTSDSWQEAPPIVLGRGAAGPANQRAVGPAVARSNLDAAIKAAFLDAGLPRMTVAAACLGLAGADRASDRRMVEVWADAVRVADSVEIVNDAVPLLHVAPATGIGIALIAGTGSLAWGRNSNGQTARCGGWGYLFSDEGSAFGIGRDVLQAVTAAVDGRGERTRLVTDVIHFLNIKSPEEIITAVYSHEVPRAVVASVACLAFPAAGKHDLVAEKILQKAAKELAEMAAVSARRLALQSDLSLSMTGAVLLQNPDFCEQVIAEIETMGIRLARKIKIEHPVSGAVNMAASQARRQAQRPEN